MIMEPLDDPILTSIEWNDEEMLALTDAIIADGRCLFPAGVNKHFNMIAILKKFQASTKKRVESKVLWDKLNELYDISKLDSIISCPFPNDQTEFSLPDNDFSQLIRDRKSQSFPDKSQDDESRDSGSGRETPPILPIAKRGAAAVQSSSSSSSTKRKYSTSFSDAGSDVGSAAGRKSTGSAKSKRRI